ncbi:MAG: SDR family oxidoreductase [Desulfuromusa sp.]|nr:SDR family oxidoreductase [Desulfuromusa sp.]
MILVTGATGFVGSAVIGQLSPQQNFTLTAVIRQDNHSFPKSVNVVKIGDINPNTDWAAALQGIAVVIHTAARVHVMQDDVADPSTEFRRVNVAGTLNLAQQAAAAGVKRFIFISSIKVNGEETSFGQPFTAKDIPAPSDPYGISKLEAEQGLRQLSDKNGIEVVIIRPPLVYGSGVKANFQTMMRWLNKGVPLPLGAIHNKRSLVALDNLVNLIITCIDHPAAANQTFLVADGEDLSTTELLQRMAHALEKPARLIPVPSRLLELGASLIGKKALAQRLCGSLQVDISKTCETLGWTPPINVDVGLRRAAAGYKAKP